MATVVMRLVLHVQAQLQITALLVTVQLT